MPRRPRRPDVDQYFHVIRHTDLPTPLFRRSRDYREFLRAMRQGLGLFKVPLVAYCVLDREWRLVAGPTGTGRIFDLVDWVTATHQTQLSRGRKKYSGEAYPDHVRPHEVLSGGRLVRVCRNVERAALSARLVRRAQDWPWCSLADRLSARPAVPLTASAFLSSGTWIRHVNADSDDDERSLYAAQQPRLLASGAERRNQRIHLVGSARDYQTDPHIERPEHLRIVQVSSSLQPLEERRYRPAAPVD